MKTQEELIKIYQDTKSNFKNYITPQTHKYSCFIKRKNLKLNNVTVENADCVEVTQRLSKLGLTTLLNMASFKKAGGGVRNGRMAQEEEICRRSNLMDSLSDSFYPLGLNEYIYSYQVSFFKNRNYETIEESYAAVLTIAALDLVVFDPKNKPDEYDSIMKAKIETIVSEPARRGAKNLVLSAFGCGVFKNDPSVIALMFKEVLASGYAELYDNIVFAILNDKNSVGDNYTIFKTIFHEL